MPKAMNTGQAAVIDPILSQHARGYQNGEFIAQRVLPIVPIPNRSMRVLKFGKESFRAMNTRRAPGAETKRVEYGYGSDPVSLHQESLEGLVPMEHQDEAQKVPGIDLGANAVEMVQDVVQLGREIEVAGALRATATYDAAHVETPAGADKWSDPASDPQAMIDDAKAAVRRKIGRDANIMTLSGDCFLALRRHPKLREQFKYTTAQSITAEMMAGYFDLQEIIVGKAVYLPESAADEDEAVDIWGDDAILSYRPVGTNFRVPSFGYIYRLNGFPVVERPYYERNRKSWVYPFTEEYRPYVTGADAGFLIKGAV